MTSVAWILLAGLVYAALHSLTASLWVKALVRRLLGPATERWYRLVFNLFAGLSLLPLLALVAWLPDQGLYQIPFPWLLLTGLGQLLGLGIILAGLLQTDPWHFTGLRQLLRRGDQPAEPPLVTGGIYARMRHPLYSGSLLVIWLLPSMTTNLLALFVLLSIYMFVGARFEERRLEHEFGQAYRAYRQRVPMLIPRLTRPSS
ncbi:MAG: isoprenylcysteine carboxylmethyltransferase family protein [Anaerolineales bacterium]|nr:isoprenylcysteine carboxylmethyltransferase family protein [Anaerolineales bacterium]